MTNKLKQYIYNEKFTSQNDMLHDIYTNTPEFSSEDQEALFDFLIEKVEAAELYSINYGYDKNLYDCSVFKDIKPHIKQTISEKLNAYLQKDQVIYEDVYCFYDFLCTLAIDNDSEKLWNKGMEKYSTFLLTAQDTDEKPLNRIDQMFCCVFYCLVKILPKNKEQLDQFRDVLFTKRSSIQKSVIIHILDYYFDYGKDKIKDLSQILYLRDFVIRYFELYYNHDRVIQFSSLNITHINDKTLIKDIFHQCIPELSDNDILYSYDKEHVGTSLLCLYQWNQLKNDITELLTLCTEKQKNMFFIFILYYRTTKEQIPSYNSSKNIPNSEFLLELNYTYYDFDFIYKSLLEWFKYFIKLPNNTFIYHLFHQLNSLKLFQECIKSQEDWNNCTQDIQKYYIIRINDETDPFWDYLTEEQKLSINQRNQNLQIGKKWDRLEEQTKTECISYFFDKEKMFDEIEYFQIYITNFDFDKLWDSTSQYKNLMFNNLEEEKDARVLNPFLLQYIPYVKNYKSIDSIYNDIKIYWDKFWGMYLYIYITEQIDSNSETKTFNVSFTDSQKVKLINYIDSNSNEFNIYTIYLLLHTFDLEYKLSNEQIIDLLKLNPVFFNGKLKQRFYISGDSLFYHNLGGWTIDINSEIINIDVIMKYSKMTIPECLDKIFSILQENDILNNRSLLLNMLNMDNTINIDSNKIDEYVLKYVLEYIKSSTNDIFSYLIKEYIIQNFDRIGMEFIQILDQSSSIPKDLYQFILYKLLNFQLEPQYKKSFYNLKLKVYKKEILIHDNSNTQKFSIQEEVEKLSNLTDISNIKEQIKNIQNKIDTYESSLQTIDTLNDNILEFIYYIDDHIELFDDICSLLITTTYIRNCDILITQIKYYRSNNININWEKLVQIFMEYKDHWVQNNDEVSRFIDSNNFFVKLLDLLIQENILSYENYMQLNKIDKIPYELKHSIEKRIQSFILPMSIEKTQDQYLLCISTNDENLIKFPEEELDQLISKIMDRFDPKYSVISRICDFEYLIKDIQYNQITFMHPYCFEDNLENNWSLVNNPIFISCWSFEQVHENSYAWWKLYGSSKKVRIEIDLEKALKSLIRKLNTGDKLYIGSLDYKKIHRTEHTKEWEYFEKKTDFKFESEFRIMIKPSNVTILDNTKILDLHSYPVKVEKTFYKGLKLDYEDPKQVHFHPYESTLSKKDKKAMSEILANTIDKV